MEKLFLFMEDFDNWELSTVDRRNQLEEAVTTFNADNSTDYDPHLSFLQYERWRQKQDM